MRIQAVCLLSLVVGLGGCSSADDSSISNGGSSGSGGASGASAGSSTQGGSGGFVNGGSGGTVNGGSGGVGAGGSGGASTGGAATGGASTGGAATGGASTGGAATGGASTGGAATGGASTGGAATGGASTGGAATGGTGGAGTGGAATGGTGGTGTGGTGGATQTCTPITVSALAPFGGNVLSGEVDPELGTSEPDYFQLEFYGATAGSRDLSVSPDDNYATCERCVRVFSDTTTTTQYYQMSGTMTLTSVDYYGSTGVIAGTTGSLSGVTLTEVTLDGNYNSTPVPGGKCLTVQSASWSYNCNDGGTSFGSPSAQACDDCQTAAFGGCCYRQANICSGSQDCLDLNTCYNACSTSSDPNCYDNCDTQYPNGVDDLAELIYCSFGDGSTFPGACGTACQ